jgi:hypothetical protein
MDSLLIPAIKNGNLIKSLLSEYFKEKFILTSFLGGGEPNSSFICFLSRTRYFSESRGGHTPLLGRAYYQMMECLGVSILL